MALKRLGPPDSPVNQLVSSSGADSGTTMRPDGQQYIYNLSTKNSQFSPGVALTIGQYELRITAPEIQTEIAIFALQ